MGAWGVHAFDNDTACDWKHRVEESDDLSVVEEAIDAAIENDEYLDANIGTEALAACEVIARLHGRWGVRNAYTESLDRWIESHSLKPSADLVTRAEAAIERVLGESSELRELWDEGDGGVAWRQSVEELRSRLQR